MGWGCGVTRILELKRWIVDQKKVVNLCIKCFHMTWILRSYFSTHRFSYFVLLLHGNSEPLSVSIFFKNDQVWCQKLSREDLQRSCCSCTHKDPILWVKLSVILFDLEWFIKNFKAGFCSLFLLNHFITRQNFKICCILFICKQLHVCHFSADVLKSVKLYLWFILLWF